MFPSPTGKLANHSLLRELEIGAVPHGFRSSELALAHVNSDRVEAAYRRTDLFEKRRELMGAWADYIA